DVAGKFVVPLPVSKGPGTYELTAELGADGLGANAIGAASILTVTTGNAAPAGSTAVVTGLGGGLPGQAQGGTLTVEDGNGAPVVGQVFSLTVDHGFFTTGQGATPSVVGAPAGDLERLGTKLTDVTDTNGQIDFRVGIARDGGFDDDGSVTATVKVSSGPTGSKSAAWSSGSELNPPLNGRVALRLSPAGEQDGPVAPALAGDRTFYEVFALDQFGNPLAGIPIDLTYSGNLDDWDYSDDFAVSDLDSFGDIWLTSFEAGAITITGTWTDDAPAYLYTDTAGTAIKSTTSVTDSITSTTYENSFNASSFSLTSSATDVVGVGSAVTQTVRVVDQQGNPVSGYEVRFFRNGPDGDHSDAVATRATNTRGEAAYTFIGTKRGRAKITADVTDGTSHRLLNGSAVFGATVTARLAKGKGGSGGDRLSVSSRAAAAGARVLIYRVVNGRRYQVATKRLDTKGKVAVKIRDRNRKAYTTYVAVVRSTSNSVADQSNTVTIR
ncbi:MAG: Ig-like domain-containing protein, partial [Aeromicrobium sp.]